MRLYHDWCRYTIEAISRLVSLTLRLKLVVFLVQFEKEFCSAFQYSEVHTLLAFIKKFLLCFDSLLRKESMHCLAVKMDFMNKQRQWCVFVEIYFYGILHQSK